MANYRKWWRNQLYIYADDSVFSAGWSPWANDRPVGLRIGRSPSGQRFTIQFGLLNATFSPRRGSNILRIPFNGRSVSGQYPLELPVALHMTLSSWLSEQMPMRVADALVDYVQSYDVTYQGTRYSNTTEPVDDNNI